jgi:phage baseplate assembly protein W
MSVANAATDSNGVVLGPSPTGIPHLAIPFTIGPLGAAATVQQDTAAEVIQSVAMLVGTEPGTRLMVPTYGMADPTFTGINQPALLLAVRRWEPRAKVTVGVTQGGEEFVTVGVQNMAGQ